VGPAVGVDLEQALRLLSFALPELTIRSVAPMDEGWESLVLDVNDELIVKIPRADWAAEKYRREQRLLTVVGPLLDTPVPRPRLIEGDPLLQMYDKLPGEMLMHGVEASVDAAAIGAQLGAFLKQLHTLSRDVLVRTGLEPGDPVHWAERWRTLAGRIEADVLPMLSSGARDAARAFFSSELDARLGSFHPTLVHGDLGGWNILVDPATSSVTAILDWGDAEIGDPAFDFTAILVELPRTSFDATLATYGPLPDDGAQGRLETYAQMYPLYSAMFAGMVGRENVRERYLEMAEAVFDEER